MALSGDHSIIPFGIGISNCLHPLTAGTSAVLEKAPILGHQGLRVTWEMEGVGVLLELIDG